MTVGIDTSAAGAISGTATLDFETDGTDGSSGLAAIANGSETVNLSGNVFRRADADVTAPVGFGNVRIGDVAQQDLTIENAAAADGFSESLNATFGGTTGSATTSGSLLQLGADSSDNSSFTVGINTSAAGTISGTATLNFQTDGTDGSSGLAAIANGSETVNVSGNVFRRAQADVSNSVSLGNARVGDVSQQVLNLGNAAAADGFSESLNANFGATTGSASASGAISQLAADSSDNSSLTIGINTSAAGAISGTATLNFQTDGTDGSSGLAAIANGSETVNVSGNVFRRAEADVTAPVSFGNVRVGDVSQQALDVGNAAAADGFSESLNASFGATTGSVTANGSISQLAADSTDNSSLTIGINTGIAGTISGTATLNFQTDGTDGSSGLAAIANGSETVNVSGTAFRPAEAVVTDEVDFGIVHVGDNLSAATIQIGNEATADQFSEDLIASNLVFTGDSELSISSSNSFSVIAGETNEVSVSIDTSSSGLRTGVFSLDLISTGEVSGDAIVGLDQLSIGQATTNVSAQVNEFADAVLTQIGGDGVFSLVDENEYLLDFGDLVVGAPELSTELSVLNDVFGFADSLAGDFTVTGDFTTSGFNSFSDLAAGDFEEGLFVEFDPLTTGSFNGQILFDPRSENASGFSGAQDRISVEIIASVGVPEPSVILVLVGIGTLLATRRYR